MSPASSRAPSAAAPSASPPRRFFLSVCPNAKRARIAPTPNRSRNSARARFRRRRFSSNASLIKGDSRNVTTLREPRFSLARLPAFADAAASSDGAAEAEAEASAAEEAFFE